MAVKKANKKEVETTPAKVVPTFRVYFMAGKAKRMNGRIRRGDSQG